MNKGNKAQALQAGKPQGRQEGRPQVYLCRLAIDNGEETQIRICAFTAWTETQAARTVEKWQVRQLFKVVPWNETEKPQGNSQGRQAGKQEGRPQVNRAGKSRIATDGQEEKPQEARQARLVISKGELIYRIAGKAAGHALNNSIVHGGKIALTIQRGLQPEILQDMTSAAYVALCECKAEERYSAAGFYKAVSAAGKVLTSVRNVIAHVIAIESLPYGEQEILGAYDEFVDGTIAMYGGGYHDKRIAAELWRLYRGLSKRQRTVLNFTITGRKQRDIAQELGISQSSVRDDMKRARKWIIEGLQTADCLPTEITEEDIITLLAIANKRTRGK